MTFPSRYVGLTEARARHGERVDRLGRFLTRGDPLADAAVAALAERGPRAREQAIQAALHGPSEGVPEALAALVAHCSDVPFWVDFERAARGGAVCMRAGVLSGMVLGLKSLVGGYCSPAGNKPLIFSGRLQETAARRLAETGRFVQAVCERDGMRPGHEGWRTSVRVRLMHAQVRHLLSKDPRWKAEDWGTPINQVDMAGTVLLFSHVLAQGLQQLGVTLSRDEREDLLHLWRHVGRVLGTEEELLSTSEHEAEVLWGLITMTQAPPDEDSRTLARALLESPLRDAKTRSERLATERFVSITYALSRYLIGDTYADALGYPKSRWRFALPAVRALIVSGDRVLRGLPGTEGVTLAAGMAYWQHSIQAGLAGASATFPLPEALRGADPRS
ncbi:DUF2236 domain-containing protein [Pyxidicoccus fallax]|uniref:DUF2236 domain-containing protein n=1 Tax=Pyxidicoccus fallax TaxID=394095 RepID=A0A848LM78_9BACT|nr:oxygenase MpaB family protein [Pyxidicoccus fallax]NMO18846.1 DUF2236 domain-containing protein [Pyxidicoccus fallax]NPC81953.1 DUF2236 domain-containing protein [Pyxidicoccus fallax]